MKVLIVDDEPNALVSLEYWLGQAGYSVELARSIEEALTKVDQFHPDVMLLDVMLSESNGFEVLQHVRQDPALRHIPVIMLTAKGRDKEVNKGLSQGANGYVIKPYSSHELLAKVRSCLENAGDHDAIPV